MLTYDVIIAGYEGEEFALEYARYFDFTEAELSECNVPRLNINYIDTINGVGVYYDWKGDCYLFTNEIE